MATINELEDLKAWQKARQLAQDIYKITRSKPFSDDYDLKRQIRRASGSVMENIAEGFGRGSRGEFSQFLGIVRGSLTEVKSQLYRATDNEYLTTEQFKTLYEATREVCAMIDRLISYLQTTPIKGKRFVKEQVKTASDSQ